MKMIKWTAKINSISINNT